MQSYLQMNTAQDYISWVPYSTRLFIGVISLNSLITPRALEVKYLVQGRHTELDKRKDPAQQNPSAGADTGSLGRIWVNEGDDGERRDS